MRSWPTRERLELFADVLPFVLAGGIGAVSIVPSPEADLSVRIFVSILFFALAFLLVVINRRIRSDRDAEAARAVAEERRHSDMRAQWIVAELGGKMEQVGEDIVVRIGGREVVLTPDSLLHRHLLGETDVQDNDTP